MLRFSIKGESKLKYITNIVYKVIKPNSLKSDGCEGKPSCVYLAKLDETRYKIGVSHNPRNRVRHLNLLSISTLKLCCRVHSLMIERMIHAMYADLEFSREYFELSEEQVNSLSESFSLSNNVPTLKHDIWFNEIIELISNSRGDLGLFLLLCVKPERQFTLTKSNVFLRQGIYKSVISSLTHEEIIGCVKLVRILNDFSGFFSGRNATQKESNKPSLKLLRGSKP